jgi:hypothetical protein
MQERGVFNHETHEKSEKNAKNGTRMDAGKTQMIAD